MAGDGFTVGLALEKKTFLWLLYMQISFGSLSYSCMDMGVMNMVGSSLHFVSSNSVEGLVV